MIKEAFILSSVFMGISVLGVGGPILGEMVATMAPLFTKKDSQTVYDLGIPVEQVSFQTIDNLTLRGWFFPAKRKDSPAILYAPATSRDQRSGISLVTPLHKAGYHVLLFSYRGHGSSDGDRLGFTYGADESKDVDAAVNFLYGERGIENVGAIGHSAGAVSVILSAARNPRIGAVVAASPFNSIDEIWETNRPILFPKPIYQFTMWTSELRKGFSRQDVRPQDVIGQIAPRPILLVHGSEDKRVTKQQAISLFSQAQEPKEFLILEGATHHQVRDPGLDEIIAQITQFFDYAFDK